MKTKSLVLALALFLFPWVLSAQFYISLTLDDDGTYSVILKSEKDVGAPVVASGQITITAPFGGFEVGELTSISGEWDSNIVKINQNILPTIEHDYFLIGMINGSEFDSMEACEEIRLFTFKNIGVNVGVASLINFEDALINQEGPKPSDDYYVEHDFSTFDASVGRLYNIVRPYNTNSPYCDSLNIELPIAVSYTHLTLPTICSV